MTIDCYILQMDTELPIDAIQGTCTYLGLPLLEDDGKLQIVDNHLAFKVWAYCSPKNDSLWVDVIPNGYSVIVMVHKDEWQLFKCDYHDEEEGLPGGVHLSNGWEPVPIVDWPDAKKKKKKKKKKSKK